MKNKKLVILLTLIFNSIIIAQDTNDKTINISGNIGQVSPLTSADRSNYSAGLAFGLNLSFPKKTIQIFKHDFQMGAELNFSNLESNQTNDDNFKLNSLIFQLHTAFNKLPVDFSFGFGISDVTIKGIAGSGILDIMHKLPNDKLDISIGLRLQQVFDINKNYKIEHLHGLYGINIKVGKPITF